MTTHPTAAAGIGLPACYAGPGWYRVHLPRPIQAPDSSHSAFVAPLPEDPDWPMPRPWLGVWLTADAVAFTGLAVFCGELEATEALIVEQIESAGYDAA